jgi:WD40 repeat protein
VGAGLYDNLMISVEPGAEKRNLGDSIVSLTFGREPSTVYAVRLTADAADDVATVLAIDHASGETTELASVTYTRPDVGEEDALREGQFEDDGGAIRLFWLQSGLLRLWSLGAGAWDIDPASGEVTETGGLPALWSPGGARRIVVTESEDVSTIALHDGDDEDPAAQTALSGLVSHVRWSPDGERVVFTLGRTARGGGLVQDLFLWDLNDGVTPTQLTSTGAAFGAEWLGSAPRWEAAE